MNCSTNRVPAKTWQLETRCIGRLVHVFETIDSTNTAALERASEPAQHGAVFLAHEQTSGRGQYGRTWTAPARSSVLMSALLFPPAELRRPALLTAWAAVSVCETIQRLTGLEARIKWPNDVLVCGKKVCGILTEQRTTGRAEQPLATVVGIGLNVHQPATFFKEADLPLGASLRCLAPPTLQASLPETAEVAKHLIRELDDCYHSLLAGRWGTLENLWKARLGLVGRRVVAHLPKGVIHGRLLDLSWDAVIMEQDTGAPLQLPPEAIRQLLDSPA